MTEIVIGIDGGGTYTRVVVCDTAGKILSTATGGGSSPSKTSHALENVQEAIRDAVAKSGQSLDDVVQLVAGMAGLDSLSDQEWAETFTQLPGLDCPRLHVNDAMVAHAGALQSRPGIIVISGTGSIIFGVTENGRQLRNYDFHQYADSQARSLSYDAVHRILAEDFQAEDEPFVNKVLAFWQASDLAELRELGATGFIEDRFERGRVFGEMAPLVTEAAKLSSPLARAVCDKAIGELGIGIRMLGNAFAGDVVSVALIGSVAQCDYIQQGLEALLFESSKKRYQIVDAAFRSEVGAVLMALFRHGVAIDEAVLSALRDYRG